MDVSKIVELVNSLDDTLIGIFVSVLTLFFIFLIVYVFYSAFSAGAKCKFYSNLALFIDYLIDREFSDVIEKEKSLPWHARLYLWFLRH